MENSRFTHPEIQKEKRKKKLFLTLLLAFLIITPSVWYVFAALNKNPPQLMFTQNNLSVLSGQTAPMPWPAIGQAAIGSTAEGVVATSSTKTIPAPTASIAKVITVLAVVQKLELKNAREQLLTLGPRDVAIYNNYKANDGSTVQVADGEQINLYDAFETMLLPSANNMADSVALWAFGSQDNYAAYANAMVRSWGLTHTTIGSDASGFSPSTLSTPSDLVVIGQHFLSSVVAEIPQLRYAVVPVAGTVYNTNPLLNSSQAYGIKTGHTNESGGCLLFVSDLKIDANHTVSIIGAVQGTPNMQAASSDSLALLNAAKLNFSKITLIETNANVGSVSSAWGQNGTIIAKDTLTTYGWKGNSYTPATTFTPTGAPLKSGQPVGTLTYKLNGRVVASTPVQIRSTLNNASILWRLSHYF